MASLSKCYIAETAEEALQCLQDHADIAVLLLDVVMESEHAGLKLCQRIREELHNDEVRILLRTGQPGAAPEKKVIENYEIDGYLSKAEMTQTRLYTAVRTALKAFTELRRAQRLEETLFFLHQSSLILDSHVGTEETLQQVLETTAQLAGVPFAFNLCGIGAPWKKALKPSVIYCLQQPVIIMKLKAVVLSCLNV